ncbi:sigma-54-dependent transcriptional regulator [Pelomonas aquatica]|jgi:two-component system response regulator PilR (NtrC family)|uniref:Sigma-54-dependent Fis family transcriptional regulator n=1 Tax=Pelomonas aquatica TaxID=431058 RepID=A0A9X4LGA8_9BURK|nr:sigma-54 dependent transcriptional regulator [Pelomonas aquatica]MCY4754160.1 sigma-54 dependent transcriptional regulator [Pelomonas aquatica]MDG0862459.1 sigma-54-dependent Fis family transcriptional regulator [Pelomonas aquatica]
MTAARLLVVDDEPDLRTLYELTLLREGYEIDSAGSVAEALALLQAGRYSAVITDMKLPDGSGLALLRWLEQAGRPEKALVITAFGSAENAVEALKAGAYDYLTKPVDLRQFRLVVGSALGRVAPEPVPVVEDAAPAPAAATALRLVGESPAIRAVRSLIDKVARSMAPVLVQGESGTGKELVARAIHEHGARVKQRFVAVNCGAIPENLLEAEFFGYRKGAFTGANEDREGFFQAADGGTLFLDEIGDLPLAMQSKLLRVIQERSVRPVGATAESPVNVRILSATHKDLGAEVAAGRFRQDLFYRLNVIQIRVPPLRERLEDLGLISNRVLARIAQDAGVSPTPRLTAGALQTLSRYAFPGNVRELENLLHRALALAGGEWIDADDLGLPDALLDEGRSESQFAALDTPLPVAPVSEGLSLPEQLPSDLARYLDEVERAILLRALEQHRFNRTAAAASLGLSLRQIRYRMARLAISAGES